MFQFLDFSETSTWIFLSVFCCIVPVLLVTAVMVMAYVSGKRLLGSVREPNIDDMLARYERLRVKNPNATREQLTRKIVARQAMIAGLVGALTSFGGILTLPIALPLDIYSSMRIQKAMVYFIARIYGHQQLATVEKSAIEYMVLTGSTSLARQGERVGTYLAARVALRVSEEALAKLIPVLGAAIGFGMNYFFTQAAGRSAIEYYSGHLNQRLGVRQRPPELRDGR